METTRRLFIPVILGTIRQGRMSAHAAQFVAYQLSGRDTVETELIDIATLPLSTTDEGQAIKDPTFSAKMNRADALVIVAPEYNHGYPGLLKHVLDTLLAEYIHKAVGVVGVSAGPFGGTRVIENLLPVLRELGLVTIFWDVIFPTYIRYSTRLASCWMTRILPNFPNFSMNSSGWQKLCATAENKLQSKNNL